jgi:MFS family permease
VLPFFAIGMGMAFVWSPLTATATRNLPPELAGAGSAVYNSVRQLGAVLGSAGMAAFMTSRIGAEMPRRPAGAGGEGLGLQLPAFLREPFSAAMAQSVLLPAFIALFGIVAALFLAGLGPSALSRAASLDDDDVVDEDYDDDDYVEFILRREPEVAPPPPARVRPPRAPSATPRPQPIGFAHNGSRVDGGRRLQPIATRGHRYRPDPDDEATGYGRHASGG